MMNEAMGENSLLRSLHWTGQVLRSLAQPVWSPAIAVDGRIRLPGVSTGLSIAAYRSLATLHRGILEADQVLAAHRDALRPTSPTLCPEGLTPLQPSSRLSNLFYKREDLTVTRAYKVRGAVNAMAQNMRVNEARRFLAVSTGNHALGVLKAAEILAPESVRIVVPKTIAPAKLEKLHHQTERVRRGGVDARLTFAGETFDEARDWALSQDKSETYLDPYCDPWVVAGQGTIGLELVRQLAPILQANSTSVEELLVVVPVGGGGLLTGTATALKMAAAWEPLFRNVSAKLLGLRLNSLESQHGDAIKVKQPGEHNRLLLSYWDVPLHTMTDDHMAEGMGFVEADLGARVEGASGGTLMPVLHRADCAPTERRLVVSLLSGGNVL